MSKYPASFMNEDGSGVTHVVSNIENEEYKIEGDCHCCVDCIEDGNCPDKYICVDEMCVTKKRRETIALLDIKQSRRIAITGLCLLASTLILFTMASSSYIANQIAPKILEAQCEKVCLMARKKKKKLRKVEVKVNNVRKSESTSNREFLCSGLCKAHPWVMAKVGPRKRLKLAIDACEDIIPSQKLISSDMVTAEKMFENFLEEQCNKIRTKQVNRGSGGICVGSYKSIVCE